MRSATRHQSDHSPASAARQLRHRRTQAILEERERDIGEDRRRVERTRSPDHSTFGYESLLEQVRSSRDEEAASSEQQAPASSTEGAEAASGPTASPQEPSQPRPGDPPPIGADAEQSRAGKIQNIPPVDRPIEEAAEEQATERKQQDDAAHDELREKQEERADALTESGLPAEAAEPSGLADPAPPSLDSGAEPGGEAPGAVLDAGAGKQAEASGGVPLPSVDVPEPEIASGDPAAEAENMEALLEAADEDSTEPVEAALPEALTDPPSSALLSASQEMESDAEPGPAELSRFGLRPTDVLSPAGQAGEEVSDDGSGAPAGRLSPAEQETAMSLLAEEAAPGEYTGGGAAGGAAIEELPTPPTPDVSGMEPEQALASVAALDPLTLKNSLGGVGAAVSQAVAGERSELAANPPEIPRPTGAPALEARSAQPPVPRGPSVPKGEKVKKVESGAEVPTPAPAPLPPPPAPVAARIPTPPLAGTPEGKVSGDDARRVDKAIRDLPSRDSGMMVEPSEPPQVAMVGNADPDLADRQRAHLAESLTESRRKGAAEIAEDMGERDIAPVVPEEMLTASLPNAAPAPIDPARPAEAVQDGSSALSIIAQQERGQDIQAAVAGASAQMAQKRHEHATTIETEKAKSAEDIAALETANAAEQATVRDATQAAVTQAREGWSSEQQALVDDSNTRAGALTNEAHAKITSKAEKADAEATAAVDKGDADAELLRKDAETQADAKKEEGEKESDGIFGWLASKAKAFFEGLKQALGKIFEAARKAIRRAIEEAKKIAVAVIETARKAIVEVIEIVGAALIAIGDELLAAFPTLREKWRSFITDKVESAKQTVNDLADKLKAGAQALLDQLGANLDKALGWLEKGLNFLVDQVAATVDSALKFADSVVQAFGLFATLIKDVASNPVGWLKNLGSAVVDGIKNHLWTALKEAVGQWFNSKLEQVLGLGPDIWNLLAQGGFSIAAIGKMVWSALKAMIPTMLVQLLIEKLVSMIVPAAGAIMAIIEGLRAGWGAIKSIIAAVNTFVAFLKQVKSGGAGPAFAKALAAAAVAVIDFVANWLIMKLVKGAAKIGGKIRGIAQRIAKRLKGKFKPLKFKKTRKNKRKGASENGKKDKRQRMQDRLDKAVKAISPQAARLLERGVGRTRFNVQLAYWRIRYRLTSLRLVGSQIIASINPDAPLTSNVKLVNIGNKLLEILDRVETRLLARHQQARANSAQATHKSSFSSQHFADLGYYRNIANGSTTLAGQQRATTPSGAHIQAHPYYQPGNLSLIKIAAGRYSSYDSMAARKLQINLQKLKPHQVSLLALEGARRPGMFGAMKVSQALAMLGIDTPEDMMYGKGNPMIYNLAAVAGDQIHQANRPGTPPLLAARKDQEKVDQARDASAADVARIFMRLRRILKGSPPVYASQTQTPLQRLATAFDKWVRTQFPMSMGTYSSEQVSSLTLELEISLWAFMRTQTEGGATSGN